MRLRGAVVGCGGYKSAVALLCAAGLGGCAGVEQVGWELASTRTVALMQIAGQQLEGEVQLRPDRTGAVRVAGAGSVASCAGTLRFTAVNSGEVDVRCSNGTMVDMRFAMVNGVKGYAFGTSQGETVVLTFGMNAAEALPYLARAQKPTVPAPSSATAVQP